MDATVQIAKITPKRAAEMLENVLEEQRPLQAHTVTAYVGEMKSGNWQLSSDCLVVISGKLANGQHRLHAVVQSETTQPFLVMETDNHQLYKVLDCGKTRTIADVLRIDHAAYISSVARAAVLYDLGSINISGGGFRAGREERQKGSRSQIIKFAETHQKSLLECVKRCVELASVNRIVAPSVMATVMFLASRDLDKPKKTWDFVTHVYDGNSVGDAAHDLRERLLRAKMGKAAYHRNYLLALCIKSFNAYIRNTRMAQVKMNEGEAFPRLGKAVPESK